MRNDPKLKNYISETSAFVNDQVSWLIEYKKRELESREYYFVAQDELGDQAGTIRLYNFSNNKFEVGSWVFKPNAPSAMAIKSYILCLQFAFEVLRYDICVIHVLKANKRVVSFHLSFNPQIEREDENNLFLNLSKENFYTRAAEILENFETTLEPLYK